MENTASLIEAYIAEFRRGEAENALCCLTSMAHEVLPDLIEAFKREQDRKTRVFLVEAIWQHRQQSVIPFLEERLHDPEPDIWKVALDGLVTLASRQAIEALRSDRKRQFPRERDAEVFRQWIDEAIEQAAIAKNRE